MASLAGVEQLQQLRLGYNELPFFQWVAGLFIAETFQSFKLEGLEDYLTPDRI